MACPRAVSLGQLAQTGTLSCSLQSGPDDVLFDELEDLCGTLGDTDAA